MRGVWYILTTTCHDLQQLFQQERQLAEQTNFRKERDSMGEFDVPSDAYYGANTMRAVLNFPISDLRFPRSFIRALGQIKLASAQVNQELELLDGGLADAIVRSAQ